VDGLSERIGPPDDRLNANNPTFGCLFCQDSAPNFRFLCALCILVGLPVEPASTHLARTRKCFPRIWVFSLLCVCVKLICTNVRVQGSSGPGARSSTVAVDNGKCARAR